MTILDSGHNMVPSVEIHRQVRLVFVSNKVDPLRLVWSWGAGQSHYLLKVLGNLAKYQ